MACKLRCPNCKRMCKEAGDHGKVAQAEYMVIKDPNFAWKWDIECMACAYRAEPSKWEDM